MKVLRVLLLLVSITFADVGGLKECKTLKDMQGECVIVNSIETNATKDKIMFVKKFQKLEGDKVKIYINDKAVFDLPENYSALDFLPCVKDYSGEPTTLHLNIGDRYDEDNIGIGLGFDVASKETIFSLLKTDKRFQDMIHVGGTYGVVDMALIIGKYKAMYKKLLIDLSNGTSLDLDEAPLECIHIELDEKTVELLGEALEEQMRQKLQ